MKPIEPGCLAVIVGGCWFSQYPSSQVNVLVFCPKGSRHTLRGVPFVMERDCWGVKVSSDGATIDVNEEHLLRIDGHEPVAVDATADEEITA